MRVKIKNIILLIAFSFFSLTSYCGDPPVPGSSPTPCQDTTSGDGGPGVPPPPGLCLPIDDYVVYLLVAGMIYGAYRAHSLRKA